MVKMPMSSGVHSTELCDGMNRLAVTELTNPALVVPRPTAAAPALTSAQPFTEDTSAQKSAKTRQALVFAAKCRELFSPDEDGDTALHLAIASSHYEVADTLIRLCPSPPLLSQQNLTQSYSPLHLAVLQNQPACVRALIVNGASITSADREGNTPLHLAAIRGYLECAEALLKPISVAEINKPDQTIVANHKPESVVDRCNYYGEQCVHLAAMGGHCRFLQFLCWNNADMNAQEGRGGRTALHFAVGAGSLEAVHCLVEPKPFGCGVDAGVHDWCGKSALAMATANRSQQILAYLLEKLQGQVDLCQDDDDATYCSDFESDSEEFNIVLDSTFA